MLNAFGFVSWIFHSLENGSVSSAEWNVFYVLRTVGIIRIFCALKKCALDQRLSHLLEFEFEIILNPLICTEAPNESTRVFPNISELSHSRPLSIYYYRYFKHSLWVFFCLNYKRTKQITKPHQNGYNVHFWCFFFWFRYFCFVTKSLLNSE